MRLSPVLLGLVATATSQFCQCKDEFTGAECKDCNYASWTADKADECVLKLDKVDADSSSVKGNIQVYNAMRKAGNYKWASNLAQLSCHSQGTWDEDALECKCNTDPVTSAELFSGKYCETCANGNLNWPACNQNCDDDCEDGGTCMPKRITSLPCGSDGTSYNVEEQQCCEWVDSNQDTQYAVINIFTRTTTDGVDTYAPTYNTCCGSTTCGQLEECVSAEVGKEFCLLKGKEECHVYKDDLVEEEEALVVETYGSCEPYETCCHGTCCASNEVCVRTLSGNIARNEYFLPGSETEYYQKNEQYICSASDYISSPTSIRVGILPSLTSIALSFVSFQVVRSAGLGDKLITLPALLTILCAFFMQFSYQWKYGIALAMGSLVAIGAQAASFNYKNAFSVGLQVMFYSAFLRGIGFSTLFVDDFSTNFFDNLANSSPTNWNRMSSCTSYYGYFSYGSNQPWNTDVTTWGYCSHGWLSFQEFVIALVVFFYFIQISATFSASYLPAPKVILKSNKKAKTTPNDNGDAVVPLDPKATGSDNVAAAPAAAADNPV